jgi:phage replication-related protein YjqB (UPF0714/DUF867 family)
LPKRGADHSYYAFDGKKPNDNRDLHITSTNFDEPVGLEIARRAQTVIAIHGSNAADDVVCVGGLNTKLAKKIKKELRVRGFQVGEHPNLRMHGDAPNNICNRGMQGAGVQFELPRGLRQKMFGDLTRAGRANPTELFHEFVATVRAALA